MSAIKWHAINCPNDYVSTLLIVQRLTVRESPAPCPSIDASQKETKYSYDAFQTTSQKSI